MSTQTLTIHLPEGLYSRLQQRAGESQRTLEAELLEVLNRAVQAEPTIPPSVLQELSKLPTMADAELWQVARSSLSRQKAARLEALHLKRQREGLTASESRLLADLVEDYERSMLIRAHAGALLKERGHDPFALKPAP
jgi:plasmid stability protein